MRLPNGYGSVIKMSGKRRKPYKVRITTGFQLNEKQDKHVQKYFVIGYAASRTEGLQMLADYHNNPFDVSESKTTFQEVYNKWSASKYKTVSRSGINGYSAAYKVCTSLYQVPFKEIRLNQLQHVIDNCEKNYPTLRKIKILMNQLYDYAMKNDICNKDYSAYVDIIKFKDKNPNKADRQKFSEKNIALFWELSEDKYYQIVLMLIYSGVRISELLALKKANVNLDKQYFDVLSSKTESGIRKVPIADKVLPFFKSWYADTDSDFCYIRTMEKSSSIATIMTAILCL